MVRIALLGILSFFISSTSVAQLGEPIVSTFSTQYGLPPLKIEKMATDSSGQLWIGSNVGLHLFNGSHFHTFNELPKTPIKDIEVDQDGIVYVGLLGQGLAVYNEVSQQFDLIYNDEIFRKSKGQAMSILITKDNKVLLSQNSAGVHEYNKKEKNFKKLVFKNLVNYIIANPVDSNKIIINADSLFSYDILKNQIELLSDRSILDVVSDSESNLWYTSYDFKGLIKHDLSTSTEELYSWEQESDIIDLGLHYFEEAILINTETGIRKFDIKAESWEDLFEKKGAVTSLYNDQKGRLWFAQDNALHVVDSQNQNFLHVPDSEGQSYIAVAQVDEDKFILAPYFGSGLQEFDARDGSLKSIDLPAEFKQYIYPFDLLSIDDWVYISFNNAMVRYNYRMKQSQKLEFGQFTSYLENNLKKKLFKSNDGYLWISAFTEQVLFRVDPSDFSIDSIHYPELKDEYTPEAKVLNDGSAIIPSENGLVLLDFGQSKNRFLPFLEDGNEVNLGYIDDFLIDGNEIWLLAGSSLFIGIVNENNITILRELDNAGAAGYNIGLEIIQCEDEDKIVLTSSSMNLYTKSKSGSIPYGISEGLVNIDRSMRMQAFGDHLFFLSQGIVYARKSDLGQEVSNPHIDIKSVLVDGQEMVNSQDLVLNHTQNNIKIGFRSINLTKPLEVKYKYRLSSDRPWIYADYDDTDVYLLDLTPGIYNFEVSTKHLYSEWSEPASLSFEIQQALWKRWWFLLLIALLFVFLAYLFYRRQIKRSGEIADLRTRMAELENEALRAQMNPHFIFNSLNSIKSYIIEHDKEEAADYLTNFSDLIRLILANSREKYIPLEKELEALKLYMDIENIRLEGKFTYEINCHVNNAMIQPLTLQPFIENAIWHGFIHKKENGKLTIDIEEHGKSIKISIEDDGVGRDKSRKIEKKHSRKRSFGIMITKERLMQSNLKNDIQIIDLKDDEGRGVGTRIEIVIPHIKPA